jgi:hypothetical protein
VKHAFLEEALVNLDPSDPVTKVSCGSGSGIRCFLIRGSGMEKNPEPRIRDPG